MPDSVAHRWHKRVPSAGHQRATLRSEIPVWPAHSRILPGHGNPLLLAHNPKVAGSNPAPATKKPQVRAPFRGALLRMRGVMSNECLTGGSAV